MKTVLTILFLSLSINANNIKEGLMKVKNSIELDLAKERVRILSTDGDLNALFQNIVRQYESLDRMLKRHPEIVKNNQLKEPKLTELKLKLLQEDEDLRDLRFTIQKLHRKLEEGYDKYPSIQEFKNRLSSIQNRLEQLK